MNAQEARANVSAAIAAKEQAQDQPRDEEWDEEWGEEWDTVMGEIESASKQGLRSVRLDRVILGPMDSVLRENQFQVVYGFNDFYYTEISW